MHIPMLRENKPRHKANMWVDMKAVTLIPNADIGSPGHQKAGYLHVAIGHSIMQWSIILKPRDVYESTMVQ